MDPAVAKALTTMGAYALGMVLLVLVLNARRRVRFGERPYFGETAKRHELSLCGVGAVGLFHGLSGPQAALLIGGSLAAITVVMWVCAWVFPQRPVQTGTPSQPRERVRG